MVKLGNLNPCFLLSKFRTLANGRMSLVPVLFQFFGVTCTKSSHCKEQHLHVTTLAIGAESMLLWPDMDI